MALTLTEKHDFLNGSISIQTICMVLLKYGTNLSLNQRRLILNIAREAKRIERRAKMKIGFFQVLGMIGMLAGELSKAAIDGKITAAEMLSIGERICESLGIELDKEGFRVQ